MDLAHSNSEPGVIPPINHINVRFVPISPIQLQIKKTQSMKTSTPTQQGTVASSLFQIAARIEDSVPSINWKRISPAPGRTPFIDLVLHPDKLEAKLNAARAENVAFDRSRAFNSNDANGTTRNSPPESVTIKKDKAHLPREIRKVEFSLKAPSARSVKLAADFTDWEKCPLELMKNEDGVWFSFIPLEPGQYSYRFIVDGQWSDDPRSTKRVPNPFGTQNALRVVT
jgi:hypothetical protein